MESCSKWKDSEVKKLFLTVEKAKQENKSLLDAFRSYAKKSKRKPNSVRNYYYMEVTSLKENKNRAEKLGIDVSKHDVLSLEKFSNEETKKLVKEILRQKCLGVSIRKACLNLAEGDVSKMVRFQNKFRSVLKTNSNLYNDILCELKTEGLQEKQKTPNVVYMKKQNQKLSDDDINSLFLGLIKLVKKTTAEDVSLKLSSETEFANTTLRNTLSKLSSAEKLIQNLKSELEAVQKNLNFVKEENCQLKTKIAHFMSEKLLKTNKNKSLAGYLKAMKEKGNEVKTKI